MNKIPLRESSSQNLSRRTFLIFTTAAAVGFVLAWCSKEETQNLPKILLSKRLDRILDQTYIDADWKLTYILDDPGNKVFEIQNFQINDRDGIVIMWVWEYKGVLIEYIKDSPIKYPNNPSWMSDGELIDILNVI